MRLIKSFDSVLGPDRSTGTQFGPLLPQAINPNIQDFNVAHGMIRSIPDAFRLWPPPLESSEVEPEEWSGHLLKFPDYADKRYEHSALIFASSRRSVEGLNPNLQSLVGSLICVYFNETELRSIAGI
ncbi:MAG TPA: hypothetical protein VLF79_03855 [Candidatus Saccharimonadales bacterium]|nr:hypothetical protein [Candidatus Saccharimonadales bacterium]